MNGSDVADRDGGWIVVGSHTNEMQMVRCKLRAQRRTWLESCFTIFTFFMCYLKNPLLSSPDEPSNICRDMLA